MVVDVIKSFDTVDRSTLDSAYGRLGRSPSFMLITPSVALSVPTPSLELPGSLLSMSGLSVRMSLLVSVFFLVPLSRSGRLRSLGTSLGMVRFGKSS